MHFIINESNQITEFHIEKWDRLSLGKKLMKSIESFINKSREDFILFALQNKLFFKTRMLFSMGKKDTYYWGCAPIYERDHESLQKLVTMGMDTEELKCAKFYLQDVNDEKYISILCEGKLLSMFKKSNYNSEDFLYTLPKKDIKDISLDFNISRNNSNCMYVFLGKEDKKLLTLEERELALVVIDSISTELTIISEKEAEKLSRDELSKKYCRMMITKPPNKEKEEKAREILSRVANDK